MKRVDFFYDFSCPYAYLGHTQIEGVCARAGAELVWKPFLLGGVFRAIGAPSVPAADMPPSKARHNALDMHRWADHFGVPLRMPDGHPNRTVLALRAALAGPAGELPAASKALFRAYWVSALDVSDPAVVRAALDQAGLDGGARVNLADRAETKEALRTRTDEAIAAGVFGAPAFLVRGASAEPILFWGQDRLGLVERVLRGKAGPAESEVAPSNSGEPRRLDFWFDFSSPFAYLGATQVEAVAARHRAELRYRPFLLGGLFRSIGTPNVPLHAMPVAKQRHAAADMERWAAHYDVPFRFPTRFPMNTVKPLRMVLSLDASRRAALIHPLFHALWALDRDISDDATFVSIADAAGFDGRALGGDAGRRREARAPRRDRRGRARRRLRCAMLRRRCGEDSDRAALLGTGSPGVRGESPRGVASPRGIGIESSRCMRLAPSAP